MSQLARSPTKSAPPRVRTSALRVVRPEPVLAIVENFVEARLAGAMVVALPGGALWIEDGRALVVADPHFEAGALARLAALIDEHAPDVVVVLGAGAQLIGEDERALLQALIARADWFWVGGDAKAASALGGVAKEELQLGALSLRHEPTGAANEVAGHLNPFAKVAGHGRRACFAYDGERMLLPAFGAPAGGSNLRTAAFTPIFPRGAHALVLAKDRVLPLAPSRLLRN